ncbi:sensor histidine kinase [Dermatobacter hominis]|uniref:sensor histidine kinase n=1 Tax=Dermatobacter hominis TaxID=2884263 RepID=UPI001D0F9992|nr:ATP-binding protein [Dermatobacter hominis]UDY36803.1 HAMP domain-containing protein [Dermatobacter hominis]
MRPLDSVRSIKLKLVIVIVAAVAISAVVSSVGWRTGIAVWLRPPIAVCLSLLLVYPFSRGITSPLRQMADAATAMAAGDFSQPITATSRDEVGDLARAFERMRSELAEVDRRRRAIIANVSHELRTPLTVLRARFENIVDGLEPNDADHAERSLAEIERLSELVDRVLDLSRLESGASPLHLERFDVGALVRDATGSLHADAPAATLTVDVSGCDEFVGDRARIHQVVQNLADNAVRHGADGRNGDRTARCTVTARTDHRSLRLTVTDLGDGIPEAERDLVVERFYRSPGARSRTTGAGLGLAIVTEIVELHGGTIEIADNEPRGCRVDVELPAPSEELLP